MNANNQYTSLAAGGAPTTQVDRPPSLKKRPWKHHYHYENSDRVLQLQRDMDIAVAYHNTLPSNGVETVLVAGAEKKKINAEAINMLDWMLGDEEKDAQDTTLPCIRIFLDNLLCCGGPTSSITTKGKPPAYDTSSRDPPPPYTDVERDASPATPPVVVRKASQKKSVPPKSREESHVDQRQPEPSEPSPPPSQPPSPKQIKHKRTQSSLISSHIRAFHRLYSTGKIHFKYLSTYQGKTNANINGCAVIAPLLAVQFFNQNSASLLPDSLIEEVIDIQTPILLPEVRHSLGLGPHALIVPSEVHDYFLNNSLFFPHQFCGVCGGDILSESHLDTFLVSLSSSSKAMAATLYFHEHVTCILKYKDSTIYEFIDSLPHSKNMYNEEFVRRKGGFRITCYDVFQLKVVLSWYACQKFTNENKIFMDMYEWDDRNHDFDPRVFQAFLWVQ